MTARALHFCFVNFSLLPPPPPLAKGSVVALFVWSAVVVWGAVRRKMEAESGNVIF